MRTSKSRLTGWDQTRLEKGRCKGRWGVGCRGRQGEGCRGRRGEGCGRGRGEVRARGSHITVASLLTSVRKGLSPVASQGDYDPKVPPAPFWDCSD